MLVGLGMLIWIPEKVCVEHVKTKNVFRTRFFTVKLREARDAKRILEILPGKKLRQLCK